MGQHYRARLFNKKTNEVEIFNRDVDECYTLAKLTEHSWWYNEFVNAICKRIYKEPQRVAWVGDYAEDCDFYLEVWETEGIGVESNDFLLDREYLVNHDKGIYLDCSKYFEMNRYYEKEKPTNWCLHPLPLLTAIGNGLGGGDYYGSDEEYVGSWANDLISVEDEIPKNYIEYEYRFTEC